MKKKDKIVLRIGLVAMVLTIIIGTSYAYWKLSKVQEDRNIIATGCFNVEFTDGDGINLTDAFPISDEEGLKLTPYTFTIENKCNDFAAYQINLESLEQSGVKVLPDEYVRVDLQDETESKANTTLNSGIETEKTLTDATKAYKLYEGNLNVNQSRTFNLRIWMDKDTPPLEETMNAFYSGKVTIEISYLKNTLEFAGTTSNTTPEYKSHASDITKIVIQNRLKPIETELSWDISNNNDGSVMSYLVPNEEDSTKYTLYLQGNGGIKANPNSSGMFANFTKVEEIVGLEYLDTSQVTNMGGMFNGCSSLKSLDLSNFDTSQVTSMGGMFNGCSSLTNLDLSNFDTSKVTDMGSMFTSCSSLTNLDLSNFDTSKVTNMSWMFDNCSSLTSLDLSNFNTSSVTRMAPGLFWGCSSLTNLNLSNWNFNGVKSLGGIFNGLSNLKEINFTNVNTSQVTNMSGIFQDCSSLTSLDLSSFDTSKVTNMGNMFSGCSSLTNLNLSNWNFNGVKSLGGIFYNLANLKQINFTNVNTSQVTSMGGMFTGCSSLTSLDLSSFDTSKVTSMNGMFSGCSSLTNLNLSNWNFNGVKSLAGFFATNSNLYEINLTNANTSQVTNMNGMFAGCSRLTKIKGLEYLDTSQVTNMSSMFSGCGNLTTLLNIRGNNITSYENMFNGAATNSRTGITVNYTAETSDLVDRMIATKSSNSNVVKGNLIS